MFEVWFLKLINNFLIKKYSLSVAELNFKLVKHSSTPLILTSRLS